MEIYTIRQAREKFFKLIDYIAQTHEPVYIRGKRNKAVMISEEKYRGLLETLYITSIPGIKESIVEAKKLPLEEFSENLDWGSNNEI